MGLAAQASASDAAAPRASYRRKVGPYTFVMLASGSKPMKTAKGRAYPYSGLYADNGSTAPLWTVDWYGQEVYLLPDGEHLARVEHRVPLRNGRADQGAPAVVVYERGRSVKQYALQDLDLEDGAVQLGKETARWAHSAKLIAERGVLRITTMDDEMLEFSMTTGELLKRSRRASKAAAP